MFSTITNIYNKKTKGPTSMVISVYFNLRNILPKSGTFPPGHPVYIYRAFHNVLRDYKHL